METDSHEVTHFLDSESTNAVKTGDRVDPSTRDIHYDDANLAMYFERPVRLTTYTWGLGASLDASFNPWQLYFNDPNVRRKLSNFRFLQADLHVKIVLNGTAFHYGHLVASYLPLPALATMHDPANYVLTGTKFRKTSMLMNVEMDPVDNKSGVLCLPFVYPFNSIPIGDLLAQVDDYSLLGKVNVLSYTPLGAASSTPVGDLTVSVFAWATNVILTGPTATVYSGIEDIPSIFAGVEATPSSEYKTEGIISKPMGLIAQGTRALTFVPYIGSTMSGISNVAAAIGSAAEYFGFGRAPQLIAASFMKRYPFASVANTRGIETVSKLSFDPKQGTTIDPIVANLDGHDELTLNRFTTKMAYITKVNWTATNAVDFVLAYGANHPMDWLETVIPLVGRAVTMTPLTAACVPFRFWSGSLVYRIKIIASKYHSGRLKFTYTPNDVVAVSEFNTQYTAIIDLEESTDVYLQVPWCNNRPYLETRDTVTSETSIASAGRAMQPNLMNGSWTISVLSQLVSPYALADVEILFYKFAGEDFELFDPVQSTTSTGDRHTIERFTPHIPAIASGEAPIETFTLFGSPRTSDVIAARQFAFSGEATLSFREAMKRYSFEHRFQVSAASSSETRYSFKLTVPRQPTYPGSVPAAIALNETPLAIPFNYSYMTLMSYLATQFLGHRGSIRYKFSPSTRGVEIQNLVFARASALGEFPFIAEMLPVPIGTVSQAAAEFSELPTGWTGAQLTDGHQQRCLEVDIPYYSNQRFHTNDKGNWGGNDYEYNLGTTLNYHDEISGVATSLDNTTNDREVLLDRWVASGEDFNFLYYLGPPQLYLPIDISP